MSQAEHSFGVNECCAIEGNDCHGTHCFDHTASADFLYRLTPGAVERYEPTGDDTNYQFAFPDAWPTFGGMHQGPPPLCGL